MTRLIGGLLVVSLLYSPAKFQVKYLAYSFIKNMNKIEYALKKEKTDSKEGESFYLLQDSKENEVDYPYMELDGDSSRISALINEKNKIYNRIESKLDLHSHLKLTLSEKQINSFADFMNCYYTEDKIIKENMRMISEGNKPGQAWLANVHNSANYDIIYEEMNTVNEYQCNVINSILRIIESGNKTLQVI